MKLQLETENLEDYLKEIPPTIQFTSPLIKQKIKEIEAQAASKKEQAKLAFELQGTKSSILLIRKAR